MDKANGLDTELKRRLMERAESYRVRLLRLDSAGREQELNKISQELAQEEQAVQIVPTSFWNASDQLSAPLHTRS